MHGIFGGEILELIDPARGIFLVAREPIGRGQRLPKFHAPDRAEGPFFRECGRTARHGIVGPVEVLSHVNHGRRGKVVNIGDLVQENPIRDGIILLVGVRRLVTRHDAPAGRTGIAAVIEIGALHRLPIDLAAAGLGGSLHFFHPRRIEIKRREKLVIGHNDGRRLSRAGWRRHRGRTGGFLPQRCKGRRGVDLFDGEVVGKEGSLAPPGEKGGNDRIDAGWDLDHGFDLGPFREMFPGRVGGVAELHPIARADEEESGGGVGAGRMKHDADDEAGRVRTDFRRRVGADPGGETVVFARLRRKAAGTDREAGEIVRLQPRAGGSGMGVVGRHVETAVLVLRLVGHPYFPTAGSALEIAVGDNGIGPRALQGEASQDDEAGGEQEL